METKFKNKKVTIKSQSSHTENSITSSKTSKSAQNAALEIHNH